MMSQKACLVATSTGKAALGIETKTVDGKMGAPLNLEAHMRLFAEVMADLEKAKKISAVIKGKIKPSYKFGVSPSRGLGGVKLKVMEMDVSVGVGGCDTDFCVKALAGWYDRDKSTIHIYRDASRSYFEPAMKRRLTSYEAMKFTILHEIGHYKGVPGDEAGADRYANNNFN